MKMILESALSDKRRLVGGVRLKVRVLKSRDFADGTRGKELYFI
jgi:hypothetical protein